MKSVYSILLLVALSGCASGLSFERSAPPEAQAERNAETGTRPRVRPAGIASRVPPPPPSARTEEEFDTTSAADREAAAATPAPATERSLGAVVVSLGDVTVPGFWLETALVSSPASGRVVFPETGKSAQVELIPIETGSRLSLAAMRLIEAPLTGLPTVEVFELP